MTEVNIDLDQLSAEVDNMSEEEIREALLKVRTQQKFQQKKNAGSDSHKAYQKKQQEKRKIMLQKAKELGLYEQINDEAEKQAQARYEEYAAENDTNGDED